MIARRLAAGLVALAIAAAIAAASPGWSASPASATNGVDAAANRDRIAVLITDWAEPEGFDPLYRREVVEAQFRRARQRTERAVTRNFLRHVSVPCSSD
ncbi:MAG: hypothetical protein R3E65_00955 [Steroidobacteraceae bacterium]